MTQKLLRGNSPIKILGISPLIAPINRKFKSSETVITWILRTALVIGIITAILYKLVGKKYLFGLPYTSIFQEHELYREFVSPDQTRSFSIFSLITGSVLWSITAAISVYLFTKIRTQTQIHPSHYSTKIMGVSLKRWATVLSAFAVAIPVLGNSLASQLSMTPSIFWTVGLSLSSLFMFIVYPSFVFTYTYNSLFKAILYSLAFSFLWPIIYVIYVLPRAILILYKRFSAFFTSGKYAKIKTGILVGIVSIVLGIFLVYLLSIVDPIFEHYMDVILDLTRNILRHLLITTWLFMANFFLSFVLFVGLILLYPELPFAIDYKLLQKPLKDFKQRINSNTNPLSTTVLILFAIPLLILFIFNAIHTYHLTALKGTDILQQYGIINYPQFAIRGVIHLLIATGSIIGLLVALYKYIFQAYKRLPKISTLNLLGSAIAILWILALSVYKIHFAISYSGPTVRRIAAYSVVSLSIMAITTALFRLYMRLKQFRPLIFRIGFINSLSVDLLLLSTLIIFFTIFAPVERISLKMIQNRIINSNTSRGFVYMFNPYYFAFSPALINTYNQFYKQDPNSLKTVLLYEYLKSQGDILDNMFLKSEQDTTIQDPTITLIFNADLKTAKFYKLLQSIRAPSISLVRKLQKIGVLKNSGITLRQCNYNSPYSTNDLFSALTLSDPNAYAPPPLTLNQIPEDKDFRQKLATNEYIVCQFTSNQDQGKTSPYPQYDYLLEVYFFDQQDSKALQILVREYKNQSSNLPSYSSGRSVFYAE